MSEQIQVLEDEPPTSSEIQPKMKEFTLEEKYSFLLQVSHQHWTLGDFYEPDFGSIFLTHRKIPEKKLLWNKLKLESRYASRITPVAYDTFTDFSKLPAELRVRIWKMTANQPRVLELCANYDDCEDCYNYQSWEGWHIVYGGEHNRIKHRNFDLNISGLHIDQDADICGEVRSVWTRSSLIMTQLPAVLQACQESRREAQRMLKPTYTSFTKPTPLPPTDGTESEGDCYLNYSQDTLYFGVGVSNTLLNHICEEICQGKCEICDQDNDENGIRTNEKAKEKSSHDNQDADDTEVTKASKHECGYERLHHKLKHVAIDIELFNWPEWRKLPELGDTQDCTMFMLANMPSLETVTIILRSEDGYDVEEGFLPIRGPTNRPIMSFKNDYQNQINVFNEIPSDSPNNSWTSEDYDAMDIFSLTSKEKDAMQMAIDTWVRMEMHEFDGCEWYGREVEDIKKLLGAWKSVPVLEFAILERRNQFQSPGNTGRVKVS